MGNAFGDPAKVLGRPALYPSARSGAPGISSDAALKCLPSHPVKSEGLLGVPTYMNL